MNLLQPFGIKTPADQDIEENRTGGINVSILLMKKLRSERVTYFPQTTQLVIDESGTENQVFRLQLQSTTLPGPHSLPDQAIAHPSCTCGALIAMPVTTLLRSGSFLGAHGMWDLSPLPRNGTHVTCIVRQILNHWTAGESQLCLFWHSRPLGPVTAALGSYPHPLPEGQPSLGVLVPCDLQEEETIALKVEGGSQWPEAEGL